MREELDVVLRHHCRGRLVWILGDRAKVAGLGARTIEALGADVDVGFVVGKDGVAGVQVH